MQIKEYKNIFILLVLMSSSLFSQERVLDSLTKLDYQELQELFFKNSNDTLANYTYGQAYLSKARKENDSLEIARGYYLKIISKEENENLFYLYDTIIELSKNIKNENFPATAYYDKGIYYHKKYLYKNALDNYIKAASYNHGSRKEHLDFLINHSLGQLKSTIAKNDEALEVTKKCYKYVVEKNYRDSNPPLYYIVLYTLTDAYRKMQYLDSARVYNRLGLLDKYKSESTINYNHFLLMDGILKLEDQHYAEAEKNISRALHQIEKTEDQTSLLLGYFYLGKIHHHLKNKELSILNYKKVDSIVQKSNTIYPEYTYAYQQIIKYYQDQNNVEQQLEYTSKLITVDSILISRYKYVNDEIINKIDIPDLISSKEILIKQLQKDKKKSNTSAYLLIAILLGITGITFYQFKKRSFYKKRFEALIQNGKTKSKTQQKKIETTPPNIPKDIVTNLLQKLIDFEEKNRYTDTSVTLNNLAIKMNTNSNYLSKVINHYKGKTFANYIKQLRVEYAFRRLKTESKLRRFTIKAIAQECGFKSAESFSKTFYATYGIYPSYFIKKLDAI